MQIKITFQIKFSESEKYQNEVTETNSINSNNSNKINSNNTNRIKNNLISKNDNALSNSKVDELNEIKSKPSNNNYKNYNSKITKKISSKKAETIVNSNKLADNSFSKNKSEIVNSTIQSSKNEIFVKEFKDNQGYITKEQKIIEENGQKYLMEINHFKDSGDLIAKATKTPLLNPENDSIKSKKSNLTSNNNFTNDNLKTKIKRKNTITIKRYSTLENKYDSTSGYWYKGS